MKRFFPAALLLALTFSLAACAAERPRPLPTLTAGQAMPATGECEAIFPRGEWQFVHSIDFSLRTGAGGTVIGVTSLTGDAIACALVTVEGLTLFEAVLHENGRLDIRRAVPPFDKPAFAQGLLEDVRAIFRAPRASGILSGQIMDNVPACRYAGVDGRITDVLRPPDGCWQIRIHGPDQAMERAIAGSSCREMAGSLIAGHLELEGFGPAGYTLKMTLIQAEKVNGETWP